MTGSGETLLAMAQRHVVEGEGCVARQAALVARLRKQGHDTAEAESLFVQFEDTLAEMRKHLDRILAEQEPNRG